MPRSEVRGSLQCEPTIRTSISLPYFPSERESTCGEPRAHELWRDDSATRNPQTPTESVVFQPYSAFRPRWSGDPLPTHFREHMNSYAKIRRSQSRCTSSFQARIILLLASHRSELQPTALRTACVAAPTLRRVRLPLVGEPRERYACPSCGGFHQCRFRRSMSRWSFFTRSASSASRSGCRAREPGTRRTRSDYFLASKNLPWWAIGTSLIAANISAEQIVGMSGSGYAIGLAIASYEWMAALTLLIVGKFFLPIFLQERHLHDAGVPREAVRPRHAQRDGRSSGSRCTSS